MPRPYKVRWLAGVYAVALILVLIASALPVSAATYQNVSDVYNSFNWDGIKMQVRSCADISCSGASFSGPDNTSGSYFTWPNDVNVTQFLLNTNLSGNQYFQYIAYLSTTSASSTPGLYNVSIEYVNQSWTSDPLITPSPAYSSAQLVCSATGYGVAQNFNLTFRWYNGTSLYNETNISSPDKIQQSVTLPAGIQQYDETWNCSVRLYINQTTYSEWKTATAQITSSTYAGTDDVFNDFQQNYITQDYTNCSVRFQTRASNLPDCSDASFTGPDNTSGTYYTNRSNNTTPNQSKRYYQYAAYMSTVNSTKTPELLNVAIYYSFDDSTAPVVSLMNPANNTAWTSPGMVNYTYNVTDAADISFCNLSINGVVNQSNASVTKNVNQSFNVSLANGNYNWSVNCTNSLGINGFSGAFNLTVRSKPDLFTSPGNLSYYPTSVRDRDNVSFNLTFFNDDVMNVSDVNVSFFVDQLLNDSVSINLSTNSSAQFNFSWIASPGLHNLSFAVDALNAFDENNESNNNVSVILNVSKVVVINMSSPLNGSAWPRGKDLTPLGEDDELKANNYLNVSARVYNLYNVSEGVSANCTFYWDNVSVGTYPTDANGVCNKSLDKSKNATGPHTVSVSFSNLSSGYVKHTSDVDKTYNVSIVQYLTTLDAVNQRDNGKYMRGDAAILNITFTRNGSLYDPAVIVVDAKDTGDVTWDTQTYPGNVVRTGLGNYYSDTIVTDDYNMIHWHVRVNDSEFFLSGVPYGDNVTVSSAIQSDVSLEAATASLNVTVSNGTYQTLNSSVQIFDRNNYRLGSWNVSVAEPVVSRYAALYDFYSINVSASSGEKVFLRRVNLTSSSVNVTPQVVSNYSGALPVGARNLSSVVALNASLFVLGNATIVLPINSLRIDYVYHCTGWNYGNASCSSWVRNETSDYGFGSNATDFWFTVYSFTAYAGGMGYNSNLSVWDDTDSVVRFFTQQVVFYANYTNGSSGSSVNGSGIYCGFRDNSSGSWSSPVNMSFNASSRLYEYNRSFDASGTYGFNVSCVDTVLGFDNISAVDGVVVSADSFAPNVSFASPTPANNTYLAVNYTVINVSVADEVAVSTCLLEWNGTNETMALLGSGQIVSCYKNKSDSEGRYAYKVYANDTTGNFGVSAGRVVTFDLTPPVILNVSLTSLVVLANASVEVSVNASDNFNVSSVWASIARPDGAGNISLALDGLYKCSFLATSYAGVYNVTVYVNDSAGNVNSSGGVNFTVSDCLSGSDCGADGLVGGSYCHGNDVSKKYRAYLCSNAGSVGASCSYSESDRVVDDCGDSAAVPGDRYCLNNSVVRDILTVMRGCDSSTVSCFSTVAGSSKEVVEVCAIGYACVSGGCVLNGTQTNVSTTSTVSSSSTSSSTTSTTIRPCPLAGDYPPCGVVSLAELTDLINLWAQGDASLGDVVGLVNAWSAGTTSTTTTSSSTSTSTSSTVTLPATTTTTSVPVTSSTVTSTTTITTLSTTTSTTVTTSSTVPGCGLAGDYPPCGEISYSEVTDLVDLWTEHGARLTDVVKLINVWAQSETATTTTVSSTTIMLTISSTGGAAVDEREKSRLAGMTPFPGDDFAEFGAVFRQVMDQSVRATVGCFY